MGTLAGETAREVDTMRVNVRYFASLREAAGLDAEPLELPDGATVREARSSLAERRPALARLLPACAVAVNRAYVSPETALAPGDEVVFIPPLGGG
jgi:molybdopterin converting factor subunit 1